MTLLVTGATGFVMSVLGREWLAADPANRVTVRTHQRRNLPLDHANQVRASVDRPGSDERTLGIAKFELEKLLAGWRGERDPIER